MIDNTNLTAEEQIVSQAADADLKAGSDESIEAVTAPFDISEAPEGELTENAPDKTEDEEFVLYAESVIEAVLFAAGYPVKYEKGFEITAPDFDGVYVAGAKAENGKLLTNGGRVLGVTATADTLEKAITKAYEKTETIHFDNAFYRHDIGKKALMAKGQ